MTGPETSSPEVARLKEEIARLLRSLGLNVSTEQTGDLACLWAQIGLARREDVLNGAAAEIRKAVEAYSEEVRSGKFPDEDHTFHVEK